MVKKRAKTAREALEAAAKSAGDQKYILKLYVAGMTPRSQEAIRTLTTICEENLAAHAPLRRLGDDEDLKGITLLFASDAGKHITGQWLAVDGGVSVVTGG